MRKDNEWFDNENESWKDYKISGKDVRFPEHKEDQNSKVTVWNLNDK